MVCNVFICVFICVFVFICVYEIGSHGINDLH